MDFAKVLLAVFLLVGVIGGCLIGVIFALLDSTMSASFVWLFYLFVSIGIGVLSAGIVYLYYKFRFYEPRH